MLRKNGLARAVMLAMALTALLAPTATTPTAQAAPAEERSIITTEAGYAGEYVRDRRVPVRVKVEPSRLVAGTLTVQTQSGKVSRRVEVAGGSVKEFLFVVPPDEFVNGFSASVTLREGGRTHRATASANYTTQEVVGLLPGAAGNGPLPAAAQMAVDVGPLRFARVGPAELALAPGSLEALQVMAAGPGELAGLGPDVAGAVEQWIAGGGRLLVDEPPGAPVAGLPGHPGLTTNAHGRAAVGAGEVVATNGAISGGRWNGLVEPSWRPTFHGGGRDGSIGAVVARAANIRQAGLGGLNGFLVLYVFIVGPVLFIVLSRTGRLHWAWVAIPVVAIVFTLGAYTMGRSLRSGARPAHASVVLLSGDRGQVLSWVGTVSQRGGTAKVSFPRQWTVAQAQAGFSDAPAVTEVTERGDRTEAALGLGAGEFGLLESYGTVRVGGGLEITGSVDKAGSATGEIVNNLPFPLDDVAVVVGGQATLIDRLGAGERKAWGLMVAPRGPNGSHPVVDVWRPGRMMPGDSFDSFDSDGPDAALTLLSSALELGDRLNAPGTVAVFGVTEGFNPPVRSGGRGVVGTTLFAAAAPLGLPADGPPGQMLSTAELIRGPVISRGEAGDSMFGMGASDMVVRVDSLNPALDPARAKLRVPGGLAAVEVWSGGRWERMAVGRAAGEGGGGGGIEGEVVVPDCPPGARCAAIGRRPFGGGVPTDIALPAGAVRNGRVYVRFDGASDDGSMDAFQLVPA